MARESPPGGRDEPRDEASLDRLDAETGERDETGSERLDRNLVELLQEVRVVQTGVQVLFAFLLTVPFSSRFGDITDFQRAAYFTALVATTVASILLIAPTALHRILFHLGQKGYMVERSNRLALWGLASTAVAMTAVMLLVCDVIFSTVAAAAISAATFAAFVAVWAVMPLRRRRQVMERRARTEPRAPRHG